MKRFIIDGFNLAYRSHFAFKDLSTSTGLFSGSIYGFLTTMRALKRRFPDFQFYVVWDNEPTTKKNAYAGYKANRIPFRVDFPIRDLKDILKCVKVVQAEMENEEADDVIASVVRADGNMDYIYSSDKDLLQLVKDGSVVVISPKVGRNEEKIYDEEAVRGKFGVGPKDLARFLAFRGDTVDNIPGAVRVHSKVIASLCNKYGSVREIYENLPGEALSDFQRRSLTDFREQASVNFSLTALNRDLFYKVTQGSSKKEDLQKLLDKYEIRALSSESYADLFDVDTSFLMREGPKLKTYSLFEE